MADRIDRAELGREGKSFFKKMRCPICEFDSTELNIHLKFHVEVDCLDDHEIIHPQTVYDNTYRKEIPIAILFDVRDTGQDYMKIQGFYLLSKLQG